MTLLRDGVNRLTLDELRLRTNRVAERVVWHFRELDGGEKCRMIRNQTFRSGTSVGASNRAASRGRSNAGFVTKVGIVLEEADVTLDWLETNIETEQLPQEELTALMADNQQLLAMIDASLNTAKS